MNVKNGYDFRHNYIYPTHTNDRILMSNYPFSSFVCSCSIFFKCDYSKLRNLRSDP